MTFHGYSIRLVEGRPRVGVERHDYREIVRSLTTACTGPRYRDERKLAALIRRTFRFDPYAEVLSQFVRMMRGINRRRRTQGLKPVPLEMVKLVRPSLCGRRLLTAEDQDSSDAAGAACCGR